MRISVLGCGRWGSFLAWYLDKIGNSVTLWGREGSERLSEFAKTRSNGMLTLNEGIELTDDLEYALHGRDVIVISVGAQSLRELARRIADLKAENRYVLCMKGLEETTGKRLSRVMAEELGDKTPVAVWVGPGHPQDFVNNIPNCMVIDSYDEEFKKYLVDNFSSELIRLYYGTDMIGNEIGAAAKNVIGIAAGMLDGLSSSSLKGALMSRGTREISRLIKAMGGNEISAYGLCHLGDYQATLFSQYSHNRRYGEAFVKGEKYCSLAEGAPTTKALVRLGQEHGVELPIVQAVYNVLYEGKDVASQLSSLFTRSAKSEF